jgi:hypothetical protein
VADLKDLAEGAAAKAAGKQLGDAITKSAKRALDDLTLSPEEKAKRDEEAKSARKKTLIKWGVIGVVGVIAVLSLMSVLASLWMYALGLLVVGGLGAGAYFYLKPKVKALRAKATARLAAKSEADAAAAKEKAIVDAAAAKQQKLEDELAALKRKAQ